MTGLPKLSKPSIEAFALVGITTLEDVARWTECDLLALHGVGPKTIRLLRPVLAEHGLAFAT
ncbi:MAG: hypothetical protein AB7O56_02295 [Bauldia sp.]